MNRILLAATSTDISAIELPWEAFDSEDIFDTSTLKTIKICPELNIHGLLLNGYSYSYYHVVALET